MKSLISALVLFVLFEAFACEPSPTIKPIEGGLRGVGITTRYWDCCKPSCAWRGNLQNKTRTPVPSCAIDGKTVIDAETFSGCVGGTSYMCSDQVGFVINSTLAYGFAAASFTGGADVSYCCTCMLLTFGGTLAKSGKKMLVQVDNTGSDLQYNQFDIAIPGGGFGLFTDGCRKQWDIDNHPWVDQKGSVVERSQCEQLPEDLRKGCLFRFDFMEGADNPPVEFEQVECPPELIEMTGCEF